MKAGGYREKRKGVYEFRVRLSDPLTGETVRRSYTWHGTKRDVGKALANWVADETRKTQVDPTERTISWLVDRWLELQSATLSPDTIRTYRGYAGMWIHPTDEEPHRIGRLPITKLLAGHLRELHAKMADEGKSTSTIRQVHAIVRGSLTYAMEREWAERNVAALRTAPKARGGEVVACTDEELTGLLAGAGERGSDLWTAIALGATLGRRLGQLCSITVSAVDLDAGTIALQPTRKSPKAQVIPIDPETAEIVKTRMEWQQARWERVHQGMHPTELVEDLYLLSFVSSGAAPSPNSYTAAFTRLRKDLGLNHLHFHCLRHYCATTLINAGVPLPVVAERLGHSSPAVTARIYAHVVAGRHEEAAAVMGRAFRSVAGAQYRLEAV